jgi:PTS system nitrogen regulatory IIA component
MHIANLITPERVACCMQTSSKKRVLEQLSQMLAEDQPNLSADEIFDSLVGRERLGSTGLGHGIAIPHGRMNGLKAPIGAFVRLESGIDFDAMDRQPVDLLFALLVPQESTSEHLQLLAQLAQMFSDAAFSGQLRASQDSQALYQLLQHWDADHASA